MYFDNRHHDWQLQGLVVVHGNVAKADHALEAVGQCRVNPLALRQQGKYIACALRYAQAFTANQVLAHVLCGLVGTLDIKGAASWWVESVAKLAGSRRYSSRALATQRSMVAALLNSTSSSIDFPLFLNVAKQSCAGAIERGFFAQYGGLEQAGLNVFAPPALACGADLVLYNG